MFTITKPSDNRVDIEFSGSLDADGMRTALDDLIEKSEGVKNGRMLYRINDITMPTLGALGVELSRLPKLFGLIGKYDKCAVVTDTEWIKRASEVEGLLIPGIEIMSFGLNNLDIAEIWLDT